MTRLSFLSHYLPEDGYGVAGIETAAALLRAGVELSTQDMMHLGRAIAPREREWHTYGPTLALCAPMWWPDIHVDGPFLGFTMNETTKLHEPWVDHINSSVGMCLVPCRQNETVFLASGVTVPIRVVPLGINPRIWHPVTRERTGTQPYRFLWSGTPDKRKGWDLVYRAFRVAFGDRTDVRLTLHFREWPVGVSGCIDRNVMAYAGRLPLPDMRHNLQYADCYVYPSRGEGWGLPPREAAATGLPVIATDWGGLAEDVFKWALPLRVKGTSVAEYGMFKTGSVGDWAEPDLDHLVELMLWCEKERNSAAEIGRHAAEWLAKNGTWDNTARGVMDAVREVSGC